MFVVGQLRIFVAPKFSFMAINKKWFKHINTLFVVLPMTLLMAFVGLIRNYGFGEDWALKFFRAWIVMAPIAYLAAFIIIPKARKLAEKVTG